MSFLGVGAAVSAGLGIAGAAGAFAPDVPDAPNYGQMTRDAQQARLDLLPANVNARLLYDPQIAALQSRINWQNLYGTPAGTRTEEYIDNQTRPASTLGISEAKQLGLVERVGGSYWSPVYGLTEAGRNEGYTLHYNGNAISRPASTVSVPRTREVTTQATPGLLELAESAAPRLNALAADSASYARRRGIEDVTTLGPQAYRALREYDPFSTDLADTLYTQAKDDLALGSTLDEGTRREVEQDSLGRWSSALAYSPEVAVNTRMNIGSAAEARRRQRQAFAGTVLNQRSQLYGDPFRILNISSARNTAPQQFDSTYASIVPDGDQAGSVAAGMYGQQAGYRNNAEIAGYNSKMGGYSSLMGTLSGLGSSGLFKKKSTSFGAEPILY